MKYEEVEYLPERSVIKATDNEGKEWFIPKDETNSDYQRYLRWLEDPNAEAHSTESVTP